jgi:hypothetical protein
MTQHLKFRHEITVNDYQCVCFFGNWSVKIFGNIRRFIGGPWDGLRPSRNLSSAARIAGNTRPRRCGVQAAILRDAARLQPQGGLKPLSEPIERFAVQVKSSKKSATHPEDDKTNRPMLALSTARHRRCGGFYFAPPMREWRDSFWLLKIKSSVLEARQICFFERCIDLVYLREGTVQVRPGLPAIPVCLQLSNIPEHP